jgi:multisubunit Na+/H+ antiporter MnhB subunit
MEAQVCTGVSALQLVAAAISFLLAVILLDRLWVKLPDEVHAPDLAPPLRRQSLLNTFVALGAGAAAVMLLVWVSACNAGL